MTLADADDPGRWFPVPAAVSFGGNYGTITLIFSCGNNNNHKKSEQATEPEQTVTKAEEKPAAPEIGEIVPGYEFYIVDNEGARVNFTFKEVKKRNWPMESIILS